MEPCEGNGKCFKICRCTCYDRATDVDHPVCTCGCRTHTSMEFCRSTPCKYSCELVSCKNVELCKYEAPRWMYSDKLPEGYKQLCFDCWAYRGELKQTEKEEACSICFEMKTLVNLSCHESHKMCLACWDTTINCKLARFEPSSCPICRKTIGGLNRTYFSSS